jgi:hypothetical protein
MATIFIPPSIIIERLRTSIPSFANRIAGAAQFDAIEDIQNCEVPALFVLLQDNTAETLANQTSIRQEVAQGFDILLVLDSVDLRKQEPEEISVGFKAEILNSLNGWKPSGYDNSDPLEFQGDSFVESDRSRYVRRYEFMSNSIWCGGEDQNTGQALGIFNTFLADLLLADHEDALALNVQIDNLYNP